MLLFAKKDFPFKMNVSQPNSISLVERGTFVLLCREIGLSYISEYLTVFEGKIDKIWYNLRNE